MKHKALIFAGAAVFDLGIMAVAAHAQTPPPTTRSTGPTSPYQEQGGTASGLRVFEDLAIIRTPGHEVKYDPVRYLKIDSVNTIRACRAQQGEVVRHEGMQQCRIPAPVAPAVGSPTSPRAGGIPPRN
ncbi:hypothetical protein [Brevundimonas sp.]|uniref:hypothetical protein n=1 Tax=Brevundimonas sp. TaxID=1871086 RepID=UPI002AB97270|nr:hypothetical protein [Brevundimonas sp.]MDZ4364154.1 hypothetical protein [Brevundimonas sp.]